MEASEQTRFNALCGQRLRALKLQGKAEARVDGYARAANAIARPLRPCSNFNLNFSKTFLMGNLACGTVDLL